MRLFVRTPARWMHHLQVHFILAALHALKLQLASRCTLIIPKTPQPAYEMCIHIQSASIS